jgi:hypothetical protein
MTAQQIIIFAVKASYLYYKCLRLILKNPFITLVFYNFHNICIITFLMNKMLLKMNCTYFSRYTKIHYQAINSRFGKPC